MVPTTVIYRRGSTFIGTDEARSAETGHRARKWPATANPHLFVNLKTAPRLTQASRPFPWKEVTFSAQGLCEDRILDKVRATGGDIRRVCELFDLSIDAALRYTTTFEHVEPDEDASQVPPTQGSY